MSKEEEDKILFSKDCIDKIYSGLRALRLKEKSRDLKKDISELLNLMDKELNYGSSSLEDKILSKMKETKSSDPSMNANLYILYRNLTAGRISHEQALEMYNIYVKIQPYDKTID